jgi:hypothetical protein
MSSRDRTSVFSTCFPLLATFPTSRTHSSPNKEATRGADCQVAPHITTRIVPNLAGSVTLSSESSTPDHGHHRAGDVGQDRAPVPRVVDIDRPSVVVMSHPRSGGREIRGRRRRSPCLLRIRRSWFVWFGLRRDGMGQLRHAWRRGAPGTAQRGPAPAQSWFYAALTTTTGAASVLLSPWFLPAVICGYRVVETAASSVSRPHG